MIEDLIAEALEQRFQSEDLSSCFLVNFEVGNKNKVTVFVESDERLTIDMCRIISRYLEKKIEEGKWLPEKYTLDVSSPGVDNPLRLHRQYVKNVGRNALVHCEDGTRVEGQLQVVSSDFITLITGSKKEVNIPFQEISKTKILVSFK